MIQGGGMDEKLREKTDGLRPPIKNEAGNGLSNQRGTIAMARTTTRTRPPPSSSSTSSTTAASLDPARVGAATPSSAR